MVLINNLERVAGLLYRHNVITSEQLKDLRKMLDEDNQPHRKKRHAARQQRPSVHGREMNAAELLESLRLTGNSGEIISEETVMRAVAAEYEIPFKKLDPLEMDSEVVTGTIPKPFALKHAVVPLYRKGNILTVAMTDPENQEVVDQITMVTGLAVERVLSTRKEIDSAIKQFFGFRTSLELAEKDVTARWSSISNLEQLSHIKGEDEISSTDQHIQNAVDSLLRDALKQRASDIHIEPKREQSHVRMRIDGVLLDTHKMPQAVHSAMVSRIKLLSRMDISEKRKPQDGRIKVKSEGREVEMRVSILPVAFGEKAVIRIFDSEMALRGLDELGFFAEEMEKYKRFLAKPHGIILITGPTGSGKTTTLYSSLKHVNSSEKNIVTIEDPIEMVVPEFNQVGVQPSVDVTFASALRAILRQDPDIIMIGEIRDKETAENAVQAALTGHLVLSTLHTNDTVSSLTRLFDLGIEPFLVKSSLIGIVSQRLVRVICRYCTKDADYSPTLLAGAGLTEDDRIHLKRGDGCEKCRFTGYMGRTGIHEVLEITNAIRKLIDKKAAEEEMKDEAFKKGMLSLRQNAIKKMKEGVTTLEETLRIFTE